MYLMIAGNRGAAIYGLFNEEVRKKKHNQHVWVRKRRRQNVEQRWGQKKRWKKFSQRAQRAWAALWDQLTNISATFAEANQHPPSEWPVTVVMYRDTISPYILSWILALLPVGGRETENEWVKERDREVRPKACCWAVGVKVKEKEKEKDVDKKENEA